MAIEFQKCNVLAVLIFVGVILIAHFVAIAENNWRIHTVSELASQGYSKKWIKQY
ncbi:hypothetical protein GH721_13995 [Kriegella sp. EG-1]|nr:hypothetical protein [Flavobacteriaceae bacterium EG-1]